MHPLVRLLTARLSRRRSQLAVLLTAAVSAGLLAAAPAGAVVVEVGPATAGVQPRNNVNVIDGMVRVNAAGKLEENPAPGSFANEGGNAVIHGTNIYVVYWDPQARYHGDWRELIDKFVHNIGVDTNTLGNVFAINTQYTDKTNVPAYNRPTLKATYDNTEPYPAAGCTDPHPLTEWKPHKTKAITCLTDVQVREGLQAFITQHGLPRGMNSVFYMVTPPGVTVCLDAGGATGHCSSFVASKVEQEKEEFSTVSYQRSFCSYHSAINTGNPSTGDGSTVLYGVIPWTAGGLGDGQFAGVDQTQGLPCQDGGFDPTSKPTIEQKELAPVQQEPNQGECPSRDGFCDQGLADLIINQIAIEQQNIVTNPLLNAWQDASRNESTDECRNFFAPAQGSAAAKPGSGAGELSNQVINGGKFYLNTAFNLAAVKLNYPGVFCLPGVSLVPSFTAPNTVNSGDIVGFDGMQSQITLNANTTFSEGGTPQSNYATFKWNFGDGTPTVSGYAPGSPACETPWLSPCASSVFHSYQYGGTYEVTLTVTDVAGNVASTSNGVTVVGPPPPSPPAKEAPAAGSAAAPTGSPTVTPGGSPAVKPTVPAPVAAASAVSRSLKTVMSKGLVVRYSVNEQVAGRFEVLLDRKTDRRLGIGGAPALGLPPGAAPAMVIAKAFLVTTKAGRSTVTIQFSKRTASRLARLRKVNLLLRLVVRNADPRSPASTTVLTPITLGR